MNASLVMTPRNPIPTGAVCAAFEGYRGVPIRYALWASTSERRRGTVCLFGGRGEFIEKYFETVTDLRRRGFAVATMDWRGQGGSGRLAANPAKGHAVNFAHHVEDVRRFMTGVVLPDCPPPYFCLAHSMGGHLVLRLAQTKSCWWERMALSAPMIRLPDKGSTNAARCAVSNAATVIGLGRLFIPGGGESTWETSPFEGNRLTSDKQRFERARDIVRAAPHLAVGSPTLGWAAAACASMSKINAMDFMERIAVPILIVAAGNDEVVSTNAIEIFASRLKMCSRIVIAGARHELLQERDAFREQFWAAFDAFIPGSDPRERKFEPY